MWKRFMVALSLSAATASALATPRNFPPEAKRGIMSPGADYTQIVIDGQVQHLAPGAKIKGRQNTILIPTSLKERAYVVNYTVDNQGWIDRVWILTAEEQAQVPQ